VLIVLCAAVVSAAESTVYDLQQVKPDQPNLAFCEASWSATKPADAGAMPDFKGAQVYFADMKLGNNPPMLVAIAWYRDTSAANRPKVTVRNANGQMVQRPAPVGYKPVVYIDRNGDRALADETPLEATKQEIKGLWRDGLATPDITIPVKYDLADGAEVTHDYTFRFVFPPGMGATPFAYALVETAWRGRIVLGGRECDLTLLDQDVDARITSMGEGRGDSYKLQPADGKPADDANGGGQLTQYVQWDGAYYRLAVRPDGAQVTVTPYDGPLATVVAVAQSGKIQPMNVSVLEFFGQNTVAYKAGNVSKMTILPGKYNVFYSLTSREGKPAVSGSFQSGSEIEVKGDETTVLKCGGKLTLDVQVNPVPAPSVGPLVPAAMSTRPAGEMLSVNITAKNAEGYAFRGNARPGVVPARVELLDSSGKVLATSSAQYG
jgi:hypothetical protein